ncbi:type II secretion system protein [Desulfitobacterium metallireducens]|uniref:N-terminal cleavage protein n=1 Tax=Desulfitobacterium metallireducens DSM 15288 TaxID=871968 RepID=W0EHT7_9FIRM|nr:type II secretion system protein [Desulfitobacterium metallireducens]AHF08636.1 hypothetical protein DESME_10640 [Desulfitobacterium metallireducens DSM 15288]
MGKDKGMTLLEVVLALTILMIGTGFIFSGYKYVFKYKTQHEIRQQMFFIAAGQMEYYLEQGSVISTPVEGINVESAVSDLTPNDYLETVTITVNSSKPEIDNVVLKTLRVRAIP